MNYLEKLYNLLENVHEAKSGNIGAYQDALSEVIEKYTDPQYNKRYICNLVTDIVCSLTDAAELHGFKQGLRHALKLVIETQHTPDSTGYEASDTLNILFKEMLEKSKAASDG